MCLLWELFVPKNQIIRHKSLTVRNLAWVSKKSFEFLGRHHVWQPLDPTLVFRGKFTRQWNILSNILWCYLNNYFLVEHFRSPSCMAISRSYPRHLVKFPEKKSILSSSRSSPYYLPGHLPIYAPNYQPGYPSGYLMLPNLTNQFIKLFDGGL